MRYQELPSSLMSYVSTTLGIQVQLQPTGLAKRLPAHLNEAYEMMVVELLGQTCLLLFQRDQDQPTPATIAKHIKLIGPQWDQAVVFVTGQMTTFNRKRLIEHQIPFIVPGNQLYLPFLGMDLREHYRQAKLVRKTVSPATQALLLYWIYHGMDGADTPVGAGNSIPYSNMTMSRAFDEVQSIIGVGPGLTVERVGRERLVRCTISGEGLWKMVRPFLRDPVAKRVRFHPPPDQPVAGPAAGLTALAEATMLNPPLTRVIAVLSSAWNQYRQLTSVHEADHQDTNASIAELWHYVPCLHHHPGSSGVPKSADPLSVYLSLANQATTDERLESALDDYLKGISWR